MDTLVRHPLDTRPLPLGPPSEIQPPDVPPDTKLSEGPDRITAGRGSFLALILGLTGGALLVIGSFLPWVLASIDASALKGLPWVLASIDASVLEGNIARAMGLDPSALAGAAGLDFSYSVTGVSGGGDGVLTLVAGLVVTALVVLVFLGMWRRKVLGSIMILAGVLCSAITLYDLSKVGAATDKWIATVAQRVQGFGLERSVLVGALKISGGVGLYLCVVGSVLVAIAGLLIFVRKTAVSTALSVEA